MGGGAGRRPAGLSLDQPAEEHLAERVGALDAAWRLMAERLEEAGQVAKLSFEVQGYGRLKLHVDRLGAPASRSRCGGCADHRGDAARGATCRTCCSRATPAPGS
ncbi:hypothetical protein SGLAM104S_06512 [Streptomyces glaucescens]